MILLQDLAVADTVAEVTETAQQVVPSFGIFEQLAQYGALGLIVLALGAAGWYLLKRQMDNQDRLNKKLQEMEEEQRKSRKRK
jgi:uncharacterized protein HemX